VVVALVVAITGFAAIAFAFGRRETTSRSEPSPSEAASPSTEPFPSVDPRVTARIPLGSDGGVSAILYAEQSVWVTASFVEGGGGVDESMLFRIDAKSNEVVAEIPLGGGPTFVSGGGGLAYGFGSVWVAGYGQIDDGSQAVAYRIDPVSNSVAASIPLNGSQGADVAVDRTVSGSLISERTTLASRGSILLPNGSLLTSPCRVTTSGASPPPDVASSRQSSNGPVTRVPARS
jgi:hypothetical protein